MSDIAIDSAADAKWAELERRVEALETKVAALPDAKQIEDRITASLPPPADPTLPPTLKDIALPMPSVDTIVATAKTTWTIVEVFRELKTLLWMLVDRRYHMGWLTRLATIVLLIVILVSHFIWPFARWDMVLSPVWDKLIDLFLGLILFMFLHFELRRYKEWQGQR
jgi:hypothetical protein